MLHKEFWGLVFLGFVFWIIAASSPSQRIENACRPIGWSGNVVVSLSALVLPDQQKTVEKWFDKVEYGCRYTVWRLFYQESYNQWKASQQQGAGAAVTQPNLAQPSAPASAPASAPSAGGATK